MKKIIRKTLIAIIVISGLYFIYYQKANEFHSELFEMSSKVITNDNKKVTRENFKKLTYNRILLPICGTCGIVEFEEIYFENDTSVVIVCEMYRPNNKWLYLTKLLNISGRVEEYRYYYKNDTLYEASDDSVSNGEYEPRYVMNIVNDSLTMNYYVDTEFINDLTAESDSME